LLSFSLAQHRRSLPPELRAELDRLVCLLLDVEECCEYEPWTLPDLLRRRGGDGRPSVR
jgi:hypothetical protein